MTETDDKDGDTALAAEYALGLLEGDEARSTHRRVLADPRFAAEVAFWQERLASLAEEVHEITPSRATKTALFSRLFGAPEKAATGLWKAWAGFATLAAAVFALIVFLPDGVTEPPALFASEVVSDAGDLRILAVVDATAHTLRLTRTAGQPLPGRVLELWGIPADGTGPVSFGVIPDSETASFAVPDALLGKADGLVLAISDEPPGGSPTGAPTGTVLATGEIQPL